MSTQQTPREVFTAQLDAALTREASEAWPERAELHAPYKLGYAMGALAGLLADGIISARDLQRQGLTLDELTSEQRAVLAKFAPPASM